ncbi:MAG: DUF6350 family protein [Nocardioides sp.]|nr:DUF6350 family protein [Nocardioides sp.]
MTATLDSARPPRDGTRRRPLALLATLAGASAAGTTLALSMVVGVVGWFITDGGAHGAPRDALRTGALGWLMSHGSGLEIDGIAITAVPLGLTLICAVVIARFALRLGESVATYGPDADDLADGDRDWTVPVASALFGATYVVIAVVTGVVAGSTDTHPDLAAVILWSLVMTGGIGGIAIAVGSGRASVWLSLAPSAVTATLHAFRSIVVTFLATAALFFLGALVLDFGAAMNVFSQLHTDTGEAALFVLLMATMLPNAVVFAGCYLLGPGFAVGGGTLVSPSLVAVGPVPMFPMLAALPDNGATPVWTPWLVALPVLIAGVGVFRSQQLRPTAAWDEGALRGVVGGALAGLLFGLLAVVAGGAVGPGRMTEVGPEPAQILFHGIVAFGMGGLLGGLLATWRERRHLPAAEND